MNQSKLEPPLGSIETVEAKDGNVIFRLREIKDNQVVVHYLSSQYNPKKEAERVLEISKKTTDKPNRSYQIVFVLGAGNPILVRLAMEKYQEIPIVVIENSIEIRELFIEWFKKTNLQHFQRNKKNLLWADFTVSDEKIREWFKKYSIKNILFLQNQKQIRLYKFFSTLKSRITKIYNERSSNQSTISRFEKLWLRNITKNTTQIIKSYPLLACKNWGQGIPAVIVGAGPSLEGVLENLKSVQKKIVIIACDTVLKILLKHNITPDIVVVIDPQKVNSKYTENIPIQKTQEIILICEPGVVNQGIRHFPFYMMFDSIFPYYCFLINFFNQKGEIDIGGTVVTAAYEIAKIFNFSHIVFTGMDFCFREDSYHFKGAMYEELFFSCLHRYQTFEMFFSKIINNEIIYALNHLGKPVYVDRKFLLFKNWLEKKFSKDKIICYNCSWGGLPIEGLPFLKFKNFVQDHIESSPTDLKSTKEKFMKQMHEKIILFQKQRTLDNPEFYKAFTQFKEQYKKLITGISDYQKILKKILGHIRNRQTHKIFSLQEEIISGAAAKIAKPFVEIVIQKTLYNITQSVDNSSHDDELDAIRNLYQELYDACTLNLLHIKKSKFEENYIYSEK